MTYMGKDYTPIHFFLKSFYQLMVAPCGDGEEIVRDFGKAMHTLLYLKWVTNQVLLSSTWNSDQCYVAAWMGREFGGERIHVHIHMYDSVP